LATSLNGAGWPRNQANPSGFGERLLLKRSLLRRRKRHPRRSKRSFLRRRKRRLRRRKRSSLRRRKRHRRRRKRSLLRKRRPRRKKSLRKRKRLPRRKKMVMSSIRKRVRKSKSEVSFIRDSSTKACYKFLSLVEIKISKCLLGWYEERKFCSLMETNHRYKSISMSKKLKNISR
jgi:hypothetical protein